MRVRKDDLKFHYGMQLVILAAGRGKRMLSLTESLPKPMLNVLGNNLIEHKLRILPKDIDEVIIVTGYLGEKISQHFGNSYNGLKIRYVKQKELLGTAMALREAEGMLKDRFMVMMGDDMYSREDVSSMLEHEWAILAKKVEKRTLGARIIVDSNYRIRDIVEGVELKKGMLNNAGLYVLQTVFFKYPIVQIPSGEFGLPQTLAKVAKDYDVGVVLSKSWQQITTPDDLEKVAKHLSKNIGD